MLVYTLRPADEAFGPKQRSERQLAKPMFTTGGDESHAVAAPSTAMPGCFLPPDETTSDRTTMTRASPGSRMIAPCR